MSSSSFQQVASHRGQGTFGPNVENVPIPNDNADDVNLVSEGHVNVSDDNATDQERVINSVHSEIDPNGNGGNGDGNAEVQLHTAAVRTTSGRTNVA